MTPEPSFPTIRVDSIDLSEEYEGPVFLFHLPNNPRLRLVVAAMDQQEATQKARKLYPDAEYQGIV